MGSPFVQSDVDRVLVGRLLLGRVMGALVAAYDRALAPFGLTVDQSKLLLNCARREANTAVKLAVLNGLDVSTITRTVDRLEEKGLLKRVRSREDRRQVHLWVTPKGHAVMRKASPVAKRAAVDAWRGVTEQEKKALRSLVHKILRNLGHVDNV